MMIQNIISGTDGTFCPSLPVSDNFAKVHPVDFAKVYISVLIPVYLIVSGVQDKDILFYASYGK